MKYRVDISRGVKIGAHHYSIKTGKVITERLKEASYYGRCYNTDKQLFVDGTLIESKFNETVIHEMLHAVNEVYCNSKVSESKIDGLANGLTQAFDSLGITFKKKK